MATKCKPPAVPLVKDILRMPLATILRLPAGVVLDCAVAVHARGWEATDSLGHGSYYFRQGREVVANSREFRPSADLGTAIAVLRHLNERGRSIRLAAAPCAAQWLVMVNGDYTESGPFEELPLVICRAALRSCLETGVNR